MLETPRSLYSMFPQFVSWAKEVSENPENERPMSPVQETGTGRIRKFNIQNVMADTVARELKELSEQVHTIAKNILLKEIPELAEVVGISIGYTGSDARGEKLSKMSPIELVIFTDDKEHPLLTKIKQVVQKHDRVFFHALEIKSKEDNLLMFNNDDPKYPQNIPFPTRVMDARYLTGSYNLWQSCNRRFFDQLVDQGKTVKAWKKDAYHKATKSFKTVMSGDRSQGVDLESGALVFDGHRVKGIKYPFLRSIQYKVDLLCMRAIREGRGTTPFPRSITERIDWLALTGIRTHKGMDWEGLKAAYVKLLLIYGASQEHFARNGGSTIKVDPDELSAIAQVIQDFTDKNFKFPKTKK